MPVVRPDVLAEGVEQEPAHHDGEQAEDALLRRICSSPMWSANDMRLSAKMWLG